MLQKRIIFIILLALIMRLFLTVAVPVTGDAGYHYAITEYFVQNLKLPVFEMITGPDPMWYPPLFHIFGSIFFLLGIFKFSSAIYGTIGVIFTYKFAELVLDKKKAFTVLLIATFLPLVLYHSSILYVCSLLFMTASITYYYYFKYLKKKDWKCLFISAIFAGFSGLVHYHGMIVPVSVFIHYLANSLKAKNVNWKAVAVLFIIPALLISPWLFRNYHEFGNPIWPIISQGTVPNLEEENTATTEKLLSLVSITHYKDLFYDFWIGAPNSGDDITYNLQVASQKTSLAPIFFYIWSFFVLILTLIMIYGIYITRKTPLFSLTILILVLCIGVTAFRNFARMLMPVVPLLITTLGIGLLEIKNKFRLEKKAFSFFMLVIIMTSLIPFAYALFYYDKFKDYGYFYEEKVNKYEFDGKVLVSYPGVYLYYTKLRNIAFFKDIDKESRIPTDILENGNYIALKKYDIKYICYDNLIRGEEKRGFFENIPFEKLFEFRYDNVYAYCAVIN